ncbi:MAG: redox-regulated ATPase YchF [Dehalococcoidia bacterium]|nr:MAG: redox-regulated ATPase YchF [Dehalococcoidia bacterium]
MSVDIGIIGLPKSGRTTVFNTLTSSKAHVNSYAREAPHIGIARVADPRLDKLVELLNPKKRIPSEIRYIDIGASVKSMTNDMAIGGEYLSQLSNTDALMNVARAFTEASVPHIEGSVDVERDIIAMELELACSDLNIIERRLHKIEISLRSTKQEERQQSQHEQNILLKTKSGLEKDIPIREQDLSVDEKKLITGYQFLSAKPLLTLLNLGEEQISEIKLIEEKFSQRFSKRNHKFIALCSKLELELGEIDSATAEECRKEFGLTEPGLERTIKTSFDLMGLITFFTTASDEIKAWSIPYGSEATKAAGKIHTDMERGFIRAEVISFNDLVKAGSITEGRKHGQLRLEGKHYIVQDGDVINFLFNV